jgi:hypothetical protein
MGQLFNMHGSRVYGSTCMVNIKTQEKSRKNEMQPSPSSTPAGGGRGSYGLCIVVVILVLHLELILHMDVDFLLLEELAAQGSIVDLDDKHIVVVSLEDQDVALS